MALVFTLEDGTGVAGANAYVSLDNLKSYWDNMVYDYSTYTDDQLKAYIIRATRNIDMIYGKIFIGTKYSATQGLLWPRSNAIDADDFLITGVPDILEFVVSEAAYMVANGTAFLPSTADGGKKVERVKVDVIEVEDEYSSSSPVGNKFPVLDGMIFSILKTGKYGAGYRGIIRVG